MAGLHIDRPADGVALLMLDRAASLNALDDDLLLRELPDALARLNDDEDVRVVVLSGEGRAFCAGADLECSGFAQPSAIEADAFMQRSHQTPVRSVSSGRPRSPPSRDRSSEPVWGWPWPVIFVSPPPN